MTFKFIFGAGIATLCLGSVAARAQSSAVDPQIGSGSVPSPEPGLSEYPAAAAGSQVGAVPAPDMPNQASMGMGDDIFGHLVFNQLEGRTSGPENEFRWDGEGWIGTDMNRLWFKSEAFFNKHGQNGHGKLEDGIHEVLYDHPIPFLRYFDWQAGFRYDGDSAPPRYWGALGVQGLAPEFFDFEATLYARDSDHFAARAVGSYDILLTNRLIAQPEIEMNFYTKEDRSRAVGRGLSELDTGLRLRYEITRKFAPYVGFAYTQQVGGTGSLVRKEGDIVYDPRFIFGIRVWY